MSSLRPSRSRWRVLLGAATILPVALAAASCTDPPTSSLNRPTDPVVVKGADVAKLLGTAPSDVVAFRWNSNAWAQVPVQVDERANLDFGLVYHQAANGVIINGYTDPNTWSGADPDATLDGDDEIAFMAKDTGGVPSVYSDPVGVVPHSGVDLSVSDPLDLNKVGHVFLYVRAAGSGLDPGAGQSYVGYTFSLTSGNYKTTYHFTAGPNPENSRVTTAYYTHHFADRWLGDELRITTAGSNGADILDRNKSLFSPVSCVRTEDTFDAGEGAFVVNKNGPVRALRSYIGANSGPNTQRTHVFYEQREDIITNLRVHAIPSILDFFDYSAAASGANYSNSLNTAGVTIDGVPDTVTAGAMQWEKVDGPAGALVQAHTFTATQAGINPTSYYQDNKTNPTVQCTGDAFAYGQSGPYLNQSLNCTDPGQGCADKLTSTRVLAMATPGQSATAAQQVANQVQQPLVVAVQVWG